MTTMNEYLPTREDALRKATYVIKAYRDYELLTREEAANAMMAFLDEHGGDVGRPWPTIEDALEWLVADDG